MKLPILPLALALCPALALAQEPAKPAGKKGPAVEEEIPFPANIPIPEATVLSPQEALQTIKVPAGYKVELVASEPLISTPVAMQFDPEGRLWVVEMNGYMPNIDGKGEDVKNGRVVVLEDTDGDGRMDKSTVFLDKLVMPRAISLRKGGALIAEPPNVYWCPDANGDLQADTKEVAIPAYTTGGNPEHMPNGLLLALDNWLYSAKSSKRYRFTQAGALKSENTAFRGQWGICQDDFGRLYYNYNSDQLRADLLPAESLARNPLFKSAEGVNVKIAKSQKTFPGRVTPGVNRGYLKGILVDGKLADFTAACGPLIYRGDLMPELRGSSFVCDTSANLVKRNIHQEKDGFIEARDAYNKTEFLTSTSERFRPVNLYDGPDGALYCVDMARGVVQHITYVTPWLRRQFIERKLELPLTQGRIWRIVPENFAKRRPAPHLAKAGAEQLVAALSNANGWTRDTAQRLLVEQGAQAPVAAIEDLLKSAKEPLARLHALWTLEGLEKLRPATLQTALADQDPKVRAGAVRLSEGFLKTDAALAGQVCALEKDPAIEVQLQLLLSLGEWNSPKATATLASLLAAHSENALARSSALSSLGGREMDFLQSLRTLPAWSNASPGKTSVVGALARCILEARKPEAVTALLELAAQPEPKLEWQRSAILNNLGSLPKGFKAFRVTAAPPVLAKLAADPASAKLAPKLEGLFTWPGKAGYEEEKALPPLTAAQKDFVAAGQQLYATICAACHQPNGAGQDGLAPALANSEWVNGPEGRIIRIVLHGLGGPVSVNGKTFNLDMPGLGAALNDEQIAQVLSYLRRDFGNSAPLVEPASVAKIRKGAKDRATAWTAPELEALH